MAFLSTGKNKGQINMNEQPSTSMFMNIIVIGKIT